MGNLFYRNLRRTYPVVKSAHGVWVEDTSGKRYLDGCSGAVVCNLGHGVTAINEAIVKQLSKVAFAHTSQFVSEAAENLAHSLVQLTPAAFRQHEYDTTGGAGPATGGDAEANASGATSNETRTAGGATARAYFVSGGSEAVETALKMARSYFVERGEMTRHLVISRWNSYHGSTLGALAATGHPARRKPYVPLLKDQPHINPSYPYRCPCASSERACYSESCACAAADQLEAMIHKLGPENVMAFMAEPIVGAALGAANPPDGYWQRIRRICTKYGVLLIADEVMTGLVRCGAAFALDLWDVSPDIIAVGKGLSAGYLPLGAVLASAFVVRAFAEGTGVFEHGFTYSGHPTACAAGSAAVGMLNQDRLISSVASRERELFSQLESLRKYDMVGDIRGRGFLAGIEFVRNRKCKEPFPAELGIAQAVTRAASRLGLLVYPGSGFVDGLQGDHIIIAPPLNITEEELHELSVRLDHALERVTKIVALRRE